MKWKQGIAIVLAGTCLCVGLLGCQKNKQTEYGSGEVETQKETNQSSNVKAVDSFALAYNPVDSMDPLSCTSAENQLISQLCFERLFVLNDAFEPKKQLCDSFEQVDDRIYKLTVRSDATFHSGQPVTAADVVFSLNNARLREDSTYQDQLSCISSVKYNDDEVTIRLYRQNANLAALLDVPIIRKGTDEDDCPDGSGPYRFVMSDGKALLASCEHWRKGKVGFCKTIALKSVKDPAAAMELLNSGEISLLMQTDAEHAEGKTKQMESVPSTRMHYLGINCDMKPYDEQKVRTALSMLLDRETIVKTCLTDKADATSVPLLSVPKNVKTVEYDPEKALDLLKDAGIYDRDGDGYLDISRGRQFKIEMIYNEKYGTKGAVLQQCAKTWTEVGIQTTVTPLTFEECQAHLRRESFELYYGEYDMTADFDISSLISTNGERNFSGYYDSDMEKALRAFTTTSGDERQEVVKDYIDCFVEQTPIIPIAFERTCIAASTKLPKQFDPWPNDIFHDIENWSAS